MSPTLSICISTLNRAHVIGATIDSIISQATDACEIIILDAASTDDTRGVVAEYASQFSRLRYFRQDTNNGLDRDFDRSVELATGEYCWLLSDDDIIKLGAIEKILQTIRSGPSLMILNAEHRDFHMSQILLPRLLDIESDREYGPDEFDRLFDETTNALVVISCIVVKRSLWVGRTRDRYYGSMFVHVGVIFQQHLPTNAVVIAEPLISLRRGNSHSPSLHASSAFEVWAVKWPALVESLAISESTKKPARDIARSSSLLGLLKWRAAGLYSLNDYRRFIQPQLHSLGQKIVPLLVGLLPGALVNFLFVMYCSTVSPTRHISLLQTLRESRYHIRNIIKSDP